MSGEIPAALNSFTECCVGLDFCSPEDEMYGTNVTWIYRQFPLPTSLDTCLIASRNGWDSISPIVPPISVKTTSAFVFLPTLKIKSLISFVICGITCTVSPK